MKNEEEEEAEQWRSVHEVLLVVLPYLHSLFELLSMTRVSRSLRDAIRDETALWTNVVVEPPLSSRLTDEILSEIASKSAGKLKTLILQQCLRVTDKGFRRVVDSNPLITKVKFLKSISISISFSNFDFDLNLELGILLISSGNFTDNCAGMFGIDSRRNHWMC